jgi:hypothetical protein
VVWLAGVRALPLAFFVIAACGGAGGQIQNLPLRWRGVDVMPTPSPSVARALATSSLSFGLRDMRADPSAVGVYQESGFIVRTSDNVGQYCTDRMGEMLVHAGARFNPSPSAALETELIDYHVIEGNTFAGTVRLRAIVRHGGGEPWTKVYVGTSKRWGRTHNPENFNEALSNALADVTQQLVRDEGFAIALSGRQGSLAPRQRSGSSGG